MERIPVLKLGPYLLVSIQVELHDQLVHNLIEDLTDQLQKHRAKGILIDISAVTILDSYMGRMLGNLAGIARLMDAETVLVGMQPAVAITLVELGITLPDVHTALNVEKGMALLEKSLANKKERLHASTGSARYGSSYR